MIQETGEYTVCLKSVRTELINKTESIVKNILLLIILHMTLVKLYIVRRAPQAAQKRAGNPLLECFVALL